MKINSLTKLSKLRNKYKNLKIGLCHGVFDVLHNGHINHFSEAKKYSPGANCRNFIPTAGI